MRFPASVARVFDTKLTFPQKIFIGFYFSSILKKAQMGDTLRSFNKHIYIFLLPKKKDKAVFKYFCYINILVFVLIFSPVFTSFWAILPLLLFYSGNEKTLETLDESYWVNHQSHFFVMETPAEGRSSDLALPKMPVAVLWIQSMPMATGVSVNTQS